MGLNAIIMVNKALEKLPVSKIEVVEKLGESTRFRLRLPVAIGDDGDLPMLSDPRIDPGTEIMILVETKGGQDCLVKGVVHAHDIYLENGGDGSYVDVLGADGMVAMNRQNKVAIWPDGTASDTVKKICDGYGLGVQLEATTATFSEDKHALVQRGSDLAFVRRLARHNGSLFWITSDLLGVETAHFRRPDLAGTPAAAIDLNQGKPGDSVHIEFDIERPVAAKLSQHDFAATAPITAELLKQPLPLLGKKGLEALHKSPPDLHLAAATDSAADLIARAEGALIEASFFVRAAVNVTTADVGTAVRAHTIVTLGGVGRRHSGNYLCAGVTHTIDEFVHTMNIELIRNALEA